MPTNISVAEHFLTALLTAADTVSASPIPVHSCLLPTPAAWGSRQRTHCDETFSSKKEKKKLFLAALVLSPDPSTTTHTFVPAEQRKQVVRAAAVDARSTSKSYLSGKSGKALSEVGGAAAVCEGTARSCFVLSVLDSSGLGRISLWQCLTHQ